jgi:hypothetical protein
VEGNPDRIARVVHGNPAIAQLVRNRWIWLACLDAQSGTLWEYRSTGFVPHLPDHPLPIVTGESANWYQGKRGFLPPVAILTTASSPSNARAMHAGSST